MLTTIIWSKDRACQLELLLRSISINLPNFNVSNIQVLYTYSNNDFKNGYNIVQRKFPHVNFIYEQNFEKDTRKILELADDYVLLLADDNIFYRHSNVTLKLIIQNLEQHNSCCFSLRLGVNCVTQDIYVKQKAYFPNEFYSVGTKNITIYIWEWRSCPRFGNFGYPFALDANIYNKYDILQNLEFSFDNTTELEGRYCKQVEHFKKYMSCLQYSISVNNPTNRVSPSGLQFGQTYNNTLEYLNQQFLENNIIDLQNIMKNDIVGCHQELNIRLVKNEHII